MDLFPVAFPMLQKYASLVHVLLLYISSHFTSPNKDSRSKRVRRDLRSSNIIFIFNHNVSIRLSGFPPFIKKKQKGRIPYSFLRQINVTNECLRVRFQGEGNVGDTETFPVVSCNMNT